MKKVHGRLIYTLLGVPCPAQKKFLEYFPKTSLPQEESEGNSWVRGQELMEASYEYAPDETIVKVLQLLSRWCSYIPFIEHMYLGGMPTFSNYEDPYDIVVITNVKRTWIVKVVVQLILAGINIFLKRKELPLMRLCLVVDRLHVDLQWIRRGVGDLMSVYRLAHLVPLYIQHENTQNIIFATNRRITYLLPKHPLYPIIQLGVPVIEGVSLIREKIERFLSTTFGDCIDWLLYSIHAIRTGGVFRYERWSRISPRVGGEASDSRTVMIQWKMYMKGDESNTDG